MRRNNMSLRLPPYLLDRPKQMSEAEKVSVNQLVTVAVAEKIARLDAEAFYRTREGRSVAGAGWHALEHMGSESPPAEGDEPPRDLRRSIRAMSSHRMISSHTIR